MLKLYRFAEFYIRKLVVLEMFVNENYIQKLVTNLLICTFRICRFMFLVQNDYIQYKNKIRGNVGKPHTEGKNCDKQIVLLNWATYFKYLEYHVSEYENDLEDKFQTYNKINGALRRHFGKQMNKETKIRIHNFTAKTAMKFGSEAWALKTREEQRLEAAQMKFLVHLLGITKTDIE